MPGIHNNLALNRKIVKDGSFFMVQKKAQCYNNLAAAIKQATANSGENFSATQKQDLANLIQSVSISLRLHHQARGRVLVTVEKVSERLETIGLKDNHERTLSNSIIKLANLEWEGAITEWIQGHRVISSAAATFIDKELGISRAKQANTSRIIDSYLENNLPETHKTDEKLLDLLRHFSCDPKSKTSQAVVLSPAELRYFSSHKVNAGQLGQKIETHTLNQAPVTFELKSPSKVSGRPGITETTSFIYEGELDTNQQRHGFGRLTKVNRVNSNSGVDRSNSDSIIGKWCHGGLIRAANLDAPQLSNPLRNNPFFSHLGAKTHRLLMGDVKNFFRRRAPLMRSVKQVSYPNGDIFIGLLNANNERQGCGILLTRSGSVFKGNWQANELHGLVKVTTMELRRDSHEKGLLSVTSSDFIVYDFGIQQYTSLPIMPKFFSDNADDQIQKNIPFWEDLKSFIETKLSEFQPLSQSRILIYRNTTIHYKQHDIYIGQINSKGQRHGRGALIDHLKGTLTMANWSGDFRGDNYEIYEATNGETTLLGKFENGKEVTDPLSFISVNRVGSSFKSLNGVNGVEPNTSVKQSKSNKLGRDLDNMFSTQARYKR